LKEFKEEFKEVKKMPCGRKRWYSARQRKAYYATGGWARKPRRRKR